MRFLLAFGGGAGPVVRMGGFDAARDEHCSRPAGSADSVGACADGRLIAPGDHRRGGRQPLGEELLHIRCTSSGAARMYDTHSVPARV